MENIDLILFNIVVVVGFIAFFISTFKAFEIAARLDNPNLQSPGLISRLKAYLQSLVSDKKIT